MARRSWQERGGSRHSCESTPPKKKPPAASLRPWSRPGRPPCRRHPAAFINGLNHAKIRGPSFVWRGRAERHRSSSDYGIDIVLDRFRILGAKRSGPDGFRQQSKIDRREKSCLSRWIERRRNTETGRCGAWRSERRASSQHVWHSGVSYLAPTPIRQLPERRVAEEYL